jgi:hypothetical protein
MDEIWNGPSMQRLRDSVRDGYVDPICQNAACNFVRETQRVFGRNAYFRCELEREYRLEPAEKALRLCAFGWSYPEQWGLWSAGERAGLNLECQWDHSRQLQMHILCRGAGYVGHSSTASRLLVNDHELGYWEFSGESWTDQLSWRSVAIPGSIVAGPEIEVNFVIERPFSPSQAGLPDIRELGIGIAAIRLSQADA